MIRTACPLDCYDACAITCDPSYPTKLVSTPAHPMSNGTLCAILNKHMHEAPRIEKPRVKGLEVSMGEALDAAATALSRAPLLQWRGSGNLGVMQGITNILIDKLGGTLTHGSLCDGAGQAGILEGRGYNRQLPPEQIAKADTVVVWGRNLTVTNSHIIPFIKGKKLVVIDPVVTAIAKKADMHLQLQPRSDFLLAVMLARFIFMENAEDSEWLSEYAEDYEDFYEFTQGFRLVASLRSIGTDLEDMGELLSYLIGQKVVFLLGAGPQKYSNGHFVFWAIDSLAATLGLFGKEGCGVSYLGNSTQGFDNPFEVDTERVSIVTTPFEKFNTVLVRGGNPAESMPDSSNVVSALRQVKNLIYFGLHENETSALADIVIPAKTFLEKNDLRFCYGHHYVEEMNRVLDGDMGIGEYEFVHAMFDRLELNGLKDEQSYLSLWKEQCKVANNYLVLPDYEEIPYAKGFGEDADEEFVFIDDYDDDFNIKKQGGKYWLLSPKSPKSLNTQFARGEKVLISMNSGFKNTEKVRVVSPHGEQVYHVKLSPDLRDDCVLIYAGSIGLNKLTPSMASEEGEGACYQEVKVTLERVEQIAV
ncbi:MAG: molybdopterin-dependent oxidoreductase [Sulfurovum sp.]|nr:molybdopterin-dependent oxidoreductase [Sulfurovum sp.]